LSAYILKKNAFPLAATLVFGALSLWTLVFGHPVVTYDSWQYLSSGKSIADGTYLQNYFWVRQPGYPLLLAAVTLFTSNLWAIVFIQVALVSITYTALFQALARWIKTLPGFGTRTGLMIASGAAWLYVGGYVCVVGQQAVISCYLAALTAFILNESQSRSTASNLRQAFGQLLEAARSWLSDFQYSTYWHW
jgi:hypothetical protein